MLNATAQRNIPGMWDRWTQVPMQGTYVHILADGYLSTEGEFDLIPGGFFAEVNEQGFGASEGTINILTVPQSLISNPKFTPMPMLARPIHLRGSAWDVDGIRLEVVPSEVQDAIRAYITLQLSSGAEALPLVVEDGWLC